MYTMKDDIKLNNIEKKMNELKKFFLYFEIFLDKIKNKNENNIRDKYNDIYHNHLFYIY